MRKIIDFFLSYYIYIIIYSVLIFALICEINRYKHISDIIKKNNNLFFMVQKQLLIQDIIFKAMIFIALLIYMIISSKDKTK